MIRRMRLLARSWATELWLNARYEPWRFLPHLAVPAWSENMAEFACDRCGSSSPRIQAKGNHMSARLWREQWR